MTDEEIKEKLIEQALNFLKEYKKFPGKLDIQANKSFICGYNKLIKLFKNMGDFKRYCNIIDFTNANTNEEFIKIYEYKGVWNENCLEWKGGTINNYGITSYKGKSYRVHRLIWELYHKIKNLKYIIPENMIIMHKCDNPGCFNINHLQLGTYKDNAKDIIIKDRKSKNPIKPKLIKPVGLKEQELINWALNNVTKKEECLIFNGNPTKDGYFKITINKKPHVLSRYIYCILNNQKYNDNTFVVRHLCNNRNCINPEHLAKGTNIENFKDSRHYHSGIKLNEDKVEKILKDYFNNKIEIDKRGNKKLFNYKWAKEFNVTENTIFSIINKTTWKDIYEKISNN